MSLCKKQSYLISFNNHFVSKNWQYNNENEKRDELDHIEYYGNRPIGSVGHSSTRRRCAYWSSGISGISRSRLYGVSSRNCDRCAKRPSLRINRIPLGVI